MKYQELQSVIKEPYFDTSAVPIVSSAVPPSSAQLAGWQHEGKILQVRRGLYLFRDRQERIDPHMLSFALYQPSYVSLESALRHYNLIPEMVPSVTAVSGRTTRTFHTVMGTFYYRHIRPELFFGYTPVQTIGGSYLLAEPEKALLDFVYYHTRTLRTGDDVAALRLNVFEFTTVVNMQKLERYLHVYDSPMMDRAITNIREYVNA